jgi:hypothetical protein
MAYYPDWADSDFPPEKIDFDRFDWIDFAFALPDSNFNLTWDDPIGAPSLLSRLVTAAHSKNKYVKLSVGGWTGSKWAPITNSDHASANVGVIVIVIVLDIFLLPSRQMQHAKSLLKTLSAHTILSTWMASISIGNIPGMKATKATK